MSIRLLVIDEGNQELQSLDDKSLGQSCDLNKLKHIKDADDIAMLEDFDPHVVIVAIDKLAKSFIHHFESINESLSCVYWVFLVSDESVLDNTPLELCDHHCVEGRYTRKKIEKAIVRSFRASVASKRLANSSRARAKQDSVDAYIGSSDAVLDLKRMLEKLSQVPISTLIITGETGTGKGLVARILRATGLRADGPMVEVNCAALPRDLLESQLFGHEAGSFTGAKGRYKGLFEQADGGTLFLDEIGDMQIDLQAKLLKAIEDKKIRRIGGTREITVDVEVIAATAKDLEKAHKNGDFREDLYHRLSVFCVSLPALRDRKEDLIEIVPKLVDEFNAIAGKRVEIIEDEAWEDISNYSWPGNVRELRNVIERCVLMAESKVLPTEWLQLKNHCSPTSDNCDIEETAIDDDETSVTLEIDGKTTLEDMDKKIIDKALSVNNYNVSETAKSLKVTRETIRYRIKKYKIKLPD